jgi:hypothetical protein
VTVSDERVEVVRKDFRVVWDPSDRYVRLELAGFVQPLRPTVGVDRVDGFDRHIETRWLGATKHGDVDRFSWVERSTGWLKRHHLDVHADHLVFGSDLTGTGRVDMVRYFDAIDNTSFVEDFALTKHFNDKGQTDARDHSAGSPIGFRQVVCPEPNSHAKQVFAPHERAQVSINADLDYCGGNFIADPGLFAFAVADDPDQSWLAFGLAVEPGEHWFSEFEYLGGSTFAFGLNAWGVPVAQGDFRPPSMIVTPGRSAEDALASYTRVLEARGLVHAPTLTTRPGWWQRPIVCGWGHQCYQADLFRIRSSAERAPDNAAYTLSTQATYRDLVSVLDDERLPWGTLVIDARWFMAAGLKNLDVGRWPDLRGFIDTLHRQGRRVLLWWSPWDPEGISDDECIRYLPEPGARQNRPGRLSKFGTPTPGKKIAVDVSLPAVRDRIRRQVHTALSAEAGCWNADGLKIDHVSAAPGIYGMSFPGESSRWFGVEAAHDVLSVIYGAAKLAKPDALVIGQSPNPYFADVQDMVRLGDIYARRADTVVPEMRFRASMARLATGPDALIDTDGWPMPSRAAWREYVREQPRLGVPSLYYATHLDTTGEAFMAEDYALIRSAWRDL